jgi:predicted lipoprotein with Yx(FWY)xxD motif
MRFKFLVATLAFGAVALAACGTGSYSSGSSGTSKQPPASPVAIATTGAVNSRATSLGNVLTSPTGRTLYALMKDTKTKSTCVGSCATVWPPLLVAKGWTAAPNLDRALFGTLARDDGTRQLEAGRWPLYTFSGDTKPGDVNGQGSGGVWFAVGTNGVPIKRAPSSSTTAPMSSGSSYGY